MEKGISRDTNYVLNFLGQEKEAEINRYIEEILNKDSITFTNKDEINEALKDIFDALILRLNEEEIAQIKSYTFLDYRVINPLLRGYWDYDESGRLTDELKMEGHKKAEVIRKSIQKVSELPFNIKTYRGVSIRSFYPYGITSLNDLIFMQDKFVYESGFTSTSLLKETSFYSNNSEWKDKCDIEIEYLIPESSDDGIPLTSNNLSHSVSLNEFLINSSSLFKVTNVEVDLEKQIAHIKMVLIPEKIWNPLDYEHERSENGLK